MRCGKKFLAEAALVACLSAPAWPQTVEVVIRAGDTVVGMGTQTLTNNVFINDEGVWLAQIATDFQQITSDEAILRNGFVTLREGAALLNPPNASVKAFLSFWMVDSGDLALIMNMNITPGTTPPGDQGLFWNTLLVGQEAALVNAPEVPAVTPWISFKNVKMNSDFTMLVVGEINNPDVTSAKELALAKLQIGPMGQVLSTNIIAARGLTLPVFDDDTVSDISDLDHQIAINSHGDFLAIIKATGGAAIVRNADTILAQEGSDGPITGRTYNQLASGSEVDLNDFGDYVFTGSLQGTGGAGTNTFLVVKNGELFAIEGDLIPSLAPHSLGKGLASPIYITNSGDVFWVAQTAGGRSFMRNFDTIISEGDEIAGTALDGVSILANAFHTSDDGRFFVGRVTLQGIGEGMLLADFGLVVPIPGCEENEGTLKKVAGLAIAGGALTLQVDNGQASGVVPLLVATALPATATECGRPTRFGELLINGSTQLGSLFGAAWTGSPRNIIVPIPNILALVDLELYAQAFFIDLSGTLPGPKIRMTNGLRMQIGAP